MVGFACRHGSRGGIESGRAENVIRSRRNAAWTGRKDKENESHAVIRRGLRFLHLRGWQEAQGSQVILKN